MNLKLITAVGSIAVDWLELPDGTEGETIGGSLSYFTRCAGVLAPVSVVGIIGTDFPEAGKALFQKYGVNCDDLQVIKGASFRWGGKYHDNWEDRTTIYTELGVFESFNPVMSAKSRNSPLVYLGNIQPALQLDVINQMESINPLIVCDTMNLWIDTMRNDLDELLNKVNVLLVNESEAELLTGYEKISSAAKVIHESGPEYVIIKQGGSGSTFFARDENFHVKVFPISRLADPTGAGDSFGGGLMAALSNGYSLKEGVIWGNAAASFCVEGFGLEGLERMTKELFKERVEVIRSSI